MIDETKLLAALEADALRREGRRAFFKAALGAAAIGAGGFAMAGGLEAATTPTEQDILNFALNLEYLEANFYSFAVYGTPIDASLTATTSGTAGVPATGGAKVTFADAATLQMVTEIAEDEIAHVKFLRLQLGSAAVAQPQIDLGATATSPFSAAAQSAGLVTAGAAFNPYAGDENFLLAAFLFEDVGVTAYRGAGSALTTAAYIDAAAGLMGTEAHHAATIRTALYLRGALSTPVAQSTGVDLIGSAGKLSAARDNLDGTGSSDDQGITANNTATGAINIAPLDSNGFAFSRTTGQVLDIVYLTKAVATSGGFFPKGMNGIVNSSTAAA